ncbi:winged helix DNA-binding protein [Halobellus rufus]|uniref:winged helix DNA-binding protein n=1 Tax=Halobellus rufus TaxID=1448860 RepID=UPI001E3F96C7|nr:winged helix DNA-binding protein [Halobellus rufus]
MRRDRAEWMRPIDDEILETIYDEGNLTPQAVENLGVCSRSHASVRLSQLRKYGLVARVADTEGLYRLTDEGRAFLNGELDASTLNATE